MIMQSTHVLACPDVFFMGCFLQEEEDYKVKRYFSHKFGMTE